MCRRRLSCILVEIMRAQLLINLEIPVLVRSLKVKSRYFWVSTWMGDSDMRIDWVPGVKSTLIAFSFSKESTRLVKLIVDIGGLDKFRAPMWKM